MMLCPNCQAKNMAGAIFCNECGSPLLVLESLTTQTIEVGHPGFTSPPKKPAAAMAQASSGSWVSLHLLETGQILPLADRNEFTMGRSSEGQPVVPDVDLAPYQGYADGVSRLHAVIKRVIGQVLIVDLDSANGTFLNGKRLTPHEEQPLTDGDILHLGKLKIQVLLRPS